MAHISSYLRGWPLTGGAGRGLTAGAGRGRQAKPGQAAGWFTEQIHEVPSPCKEAPRAAPPAQLSKAAAAAEPAADSRAQPSARTAVAPAKPATDQPTAARRSSRTRHSSSAVPPGSVHVGGTTGGGYYHSVRRPSTQPSKGPRSEGVREEELGSGCRVEVGRSGGSGGAPQPVSPMPMHQNWLQCDKCEAWRQVTAPEVERYENSEVSWECALNRNTGSGGYRPNVCKQNVDKDDDIPLDMIVEPSSTSSGSSTGSTTNTASTASSGKSKATVANPRKRPRVTSRPSSHRSTSSLLDDSIPVRAEDLRDEFGITFSSINPYSARTVGNSELYHRYEAYKHARTVGEARRLGARDSDLVRDISQIGVSPRFPLSTIERHVLWYPLQPLSTHPPHFISPSSQLIVNQRWVN